MQRVVVDADVIINFTRGRDPLFRILYTKASQKEINLYIPSIVVSELVAGQESRETKKLEKLQRLILKCEYVPLSYDLSEEAGFLLRDYKHLKLGDAVVAATCLSLNAKLATRNVKDFSEIRGLKFFKLRTSKQLQ